MNDDELSLEASRRVKRVLKWTVPVDDASHPIGMGKVVHVGYHPGNVLEVQVWTEELGDGAPSERRRARAYGTGHQVPDRAEHLGSVVAGVFVWHLYAVTA